MFCFRSTKGAANKKEKAKLQSGNKSNSPANVKDVTCGETSKTPGRRSNRSGYAASVISAKRKKDVTVDKSGSTPTTSPENENPRRKTRSSAAGIKD